MKHLLRRATTVLTRNLNPVEDGVHFHAGTAGPYVCDDPRCVSPHLAARDR